LRRPAAAAPRTGVVAGGDGALWAMARGAMDVRRVGAVAWRAARAEPDGAAPGVSTRARVGRASALAALARRLPHLRSGSGGLGRVPCADGVLAQRDGGADVDAARRVASGNRP